MQEKVTQMTIQYDGGYFMIPEPLVRGYGPNAHTARDLSQLSHYSVDAVNHIQETPWQVNPFILDTVKAFRELGQNVTIRTRDEDEVVLRLEMPVDPRALNPETLKPHHPIFEQLPKHVWEGMDKEAKRDFRERRASLLKGYEEDLGTYRATIRLLSLAEEMSQFEKFYFPHNMDFRTRIYPIPTDLTPQSNDLSKGLLRFARPSQLGEAGVYWMGFTVASHYGEDKLSPDARFEFAKRLLEEGDIFGWVDDPVNNRGWLKTDAPFQFLAVAYEWVWAHRQGNPEYFFSRLPCNLDGSCNGAQHLSIMARDLVGATATNCRSNEATKGQRFDLYMEVADRVWEQVQADADAGLAVALEWRPKLMEKSDRRKVVKRSVMTVPYGVTDYGVADFMIKDKHVDSKSRNKWEAAKYMRDLIMGSINSTLQNGRNLQYWFSECAAICAEAGKPLQWDTPAGSKITQAYRNVVAKRIRAFATQFYIYEEPEQDEDDEEFLSRIGMDERKMATAAPPNVVHSCDASHLQITVCRMADAGIRDFSMIHDSFGCPFAQAGLMRDILRQTIVDMYADNYLLKWKESVERYSGLKMPDPPSLGEFDINEILTSEFFFS